MLPAPYIEAAPGKCVCPLQKAQLIERMIPLGVVTCPKAFQVQWHVYERAPEDRIGVSREVFAKNLGSSNGSICGGMKQEADSNPSATRCSRHRAAQTTAERKTNCMKTVKLFNPTTGEAPSLPVAELAPGVIGAMTLDQGFVYIPLHSVARSKHFVHPPFPVAVRAHLRRIQSALREVEPDTLDGWERSFRRDCNPDREIRTWLWIAETYSEFASGKWQSDVRKRDYFQLCLGWTLTHDADAVMATTKLRRLEAGEAKEILAEFPQREVNIETLLIGNPMVSDSPPIWEFMGITDSAQFKSTVEDADAIVAIDTRSNTCRRDGRFHVAFGLEALREKKASGVDAEVGIAFFALDFHYAHEVTQFIHEVYAATGYLCEDFTIRD